MAWGAHHPQSPTVHQQTGCTLPCPDTPTNCPVHHNYSCCTINQSMTPLLRSEEGPILPASGVCWAARERAPRCSQHTLKQSPTPLARRPQEHRQRPCCCWLVEQPLSRPPQKKTTTTTNRRDTQAVYVCLSSCLSHLSHMPRLLLVNTRRLTALEESSCCRPVLCWCTVCPGRQRTPVPHHWSVAVAWCTVTQVRSSTQHHTE